MAFDSNLAERVRALLSAEIGFMEKKMFGGIAFLVKGNMCCGVMNDDLILRVDPTKHEKYVGKKHAREFDLSGRKSMPGWILVGPGGFANSRDLAKWVGYGIEFVRTMPAKKKK